MKIKRIGDQINIVWITDIHLSDRPPGRRSDAYRSQIFDKLRQIKQICVNNNAICLVGGDVFHIKAPKSAANPLSLIREAIEVFSEFPGGCVYGCVGNHDIQFDRVDTLPHQPLGILIEAGVYRPLNNDSLVIEVREEAGLDPSIRLQVDTWDYAEPEPTLQALKQSGPRPEGIDYRLGIVHASGCSGDTREYNEQIALIGYNQLRKLDYDILLWGHDHTRTETECCGNITHINLGSVARAALTSDEADRPVSVVLLQFTSEKAKIKEIPLMVVPLEEAFRVEDKRVLDVGGGAEMKVFFSELAESVDEIQSSDPVTVVELLCKDNPKLCSHVKEWCNL
jgi:DNA repair exonuclease SbcCD nuclease subunit